MGRIKDERKAELKEFRQFIYLIYFLRLTNNPILNPPVKPNPLSDPVVNAWWFPK